MNVTQETILKVATTSDPVKVAGALASMLRNFKMSTLRGIGAGANNQLLKSLAIAQMYVQADGLKASFTTEFETITVNGEEVTAIRVNAKAQKVPQRINGKFVKATA